MKKKNKLFLAGIAMAGIAGISASNALAGDVQMNASVIIASSITEAVTRDLDFGTVDLDPNTSTVTLNASLAGTAGQNATSAVTSGLSIVTGGSSGLITVDAAMNLNITVTYPNDSTVTLPTTGQPPATVDGIAANSQGGGATVISHTGGSTTTIAVGGYINFTGNEPNGAHSGSMTITLNYI